MRIYAETRRRLALQVAGDVGLVAWAVVWASLGRALHDLVSRLVRPGRVVARAGRGLSQGATSAGDRAEDVPLVGDRLCRPLDDIADAGRALTQAGLDQTDTVQTVALWLGLLVALVPIVYVTVRRVKSRLRWAGEATEAARLRHDPGGLRLLALRALAGGPLGELRRAAPDPVAAFADGDHLGLARLELRALGLRPAEDAAVTQADPKFRAGGGGRTGLGPPGAYGERVLADLASNHARALGATRRIVAGIGDQQWGDPTPCSEWDVRGVLNHIVSENLWVGELAAGRTIEEVGDRLDGDVVGDDPLVAYDTSARVAAAAFVSPGGLARPYAVSYGPVPGEVYARHRLLDVVVHGWDLARGTGQDARLDPELVEACWEVVELEAEELTASGVFGTPVETPPSADLQTRLLARLGRRA